MNTRANIMYFIEHFLDSAKREGHLAYIRMMQRDIIRVVDAVAPDDGTGAANVRVVRKVLQALQTKGYIEPQAVAQIHEVLKERETTADDLGLVSPNGDEDMADASSGRPPRGHHRLEKRQIEQRIEEDRERHKRERESIWAVPAGSDAEMNRIWEDTSDFGEDDDRLLADEAEDFAKEMQTRGCPHQPAPGDVTWG